MISSYQEDSVLCVPAHVAVPLLLELRKVINKYFLSDIIVLSLDWSLDEAPDKELTLHSPPEL